MTLTTITATSTTPSAAYWCRSTWRSGEWGIYLVEKSRGYDGEALRLVSILRERLRLNLGDSSESLTIDTNDRDNWPDMIDWLHDKLNNYRRVIERYSPGSAEEAPEYEPAEFE